MAFDSNQMIYIAIYIIYIILLFHFQDTVLKMPKEEKGGRDDLIYLDFFLFEKKKMKPFSNINIFFNSHTQL